MVRSALIKNSSFDNSQNSNGKLNPRKSQRRLTAALHVRGVEIGWDRTSKGLDLGFSPCVIFIICYITSIGSPSRPDSQTKDVTFLLFFSTVARLLNDDMER